MLATDSLPWNALKLTGPEIPWADLKTLADAIASDDRARDRLLGEMHAYLDRRYACDESSYPEQTDLAVPAVVALAAGRLSDEGRRAAAESLLHALYRAGEEDDDFMLEVILAAAGRLGAAVVEPGLNLIEAHGTTLECWPDLFSLMRLVPQADPQTKARAIQICRRLVREMEDRFEPFSDAQCPARVLAWLRDTESLPALEEMASHAQDGEIEDIVEEMKSAADSTKWSTKEIWDTPVEEWLPQQWAATRQYLAGETEPEAVDEDAEDEAARDAEDEEDLEPSENSAEELYGDMLDEFVESPECEALSEAVEDHAWFAVQCLVSHAWEYVGVGLEKLSAGELEEILLDLFPSKIAAESDFYDAAPTILKTFFKWAAARGDIANADELCRTVDACASKMQARARDPQFWSPAKSIGMVAGLAGPDEDNTVEALVEKMNTPKPDRYVPPVAESDDDVYYGAIEPIRREKPRCGRNDPCPCGSGRKHKKCCGKASK